MRRSGDLDAGGARGAGGQIVLLAFLVLGSATAQIDSSSVTGRVTSRVSGAPVPLALVKVVEGRAQTLTDSSGRFRLTGLGASTHVIRVQRVGYLPLELEVDLAPGETVVIPAGFLQLDALAVRIDSIVVTAQGTRLAPSLVGQGFYERRRMGAGVFVDRAAIAAGTAATVSDALRGAAGITISVNPNYHRAARAPRRGVFGTVEGSSKMGVDTRKYLITMRGCAEIGVWLDGVLIGGTQEIDVDGLVGLVQVEAVEAFRGPSEIPARFANSLYPCGALVLWTRAGAN